MARVWSLLTAETYVLLSKPICIMGSSRREKEIEKPFSIERRERQNAIYEQLLLTGAKLGGGYLYCHKFEKEMRRDQSSLAEFYVKGRIGASEKKFKTDQLENCIQLVRGIMKVWEN